jgi:hypothetical protein
VWVTWQVAVGARNMFDAAAPRRDSGGFGSGRLPSMVQGTRRPFLFSFLLCSNSIKFSQEWQNKIKIKSSTTDSSLSCGFFPRRSPPGGYSARVKGG